MKKLSLACATVLVAAAASAAVSGSNVGDSIRIKAGTVEQTLEVTTTREYDTVNKRYDFVEELPVTNQWGAVIGTNVVTNVNFVCYLKVNLSRSKDYSVWLTDAAGENIALESIEPRELTEAEEEAGTFDPGAMFIEYSGKWGRCHYMSEDEWYIDEEDPTMSDPSSWDYVIKVSSGTNAESAVIHVQQGNALPFGTEGNALQLESIPEGDGRSVPAGKLTSSHPFVVNEYTFCFKTAVQAGRRYLFATDGASANNAYTLSLGTGIVTDFAKSGWASGSNASLTYVPDLDEELVVTAAESSTNEPSAKVALRYAVLPTRTPAKHNPTALSVGTPSASFRPGRINETDLFGVYYDKVIDQELFAVALEKGGRYVASTSGSDTELLMRVYNAAGEIVASSTVDGTEADDVRCGFTATYAGNYYVGVCQSLKDDDFDELTAGPVTVLVEKVETSEGEPDAWDDADDDYTSATRLEPVAIGSLWQSPDKVDRTGNGPHRLDKFDWYDVYSLTVRTGMTYQVQATVAEGLEPEAALSCEVFKIEGKYIRAVTVEGSLNPGDSVPLTIAALENAKYYLRVHTAQGLGLAYPEYTLHTSVCDSDTGVGSGIGQLRVVTKGAPAATWTLDKEKLAYSDGDLVALKANSSHTVKFSNVTGFTKPSDATVKVAGGQVTNYVGPYTDKYDHKDDQASGKGTFGGKSVTYGATSWSVSSKETSQSRTLWTDDPADVFAITGKDGLYFDFGLVQSGYDGNEPDAVFDIASADSGKKLCEGVTSVSKFTIPKGKHYLTVRHADPKSPKDAAYTISGYSANVGAIKFAKTAVSAKDSAASVALTVNRTAKDGKVRVRYSTVAGTAKPGERYVAQNGVLTWENGDSKAKTITVALLPKVLPVYAGSTAAFTVELRPFAEGELGEDEYLAQILADVCTVTVTESASKSVTTAEAAYAKKQPKAATVKTETAGLETGTFYGVLKAQGETSGLAAAASVTFTASTAATAALSAKVSLAGKTYSFSAKGWDEDVDSTSRVKRFESAGNVLEVSVRPGSAADWKQSGGTAKLTVGGVAYGGAIYRQNAKIQDYLDSVLDFYGYYTAALEYDPKSMAYSAEGVPLAPAGIGYLTVTVDNKGTAKVSGLLSDSTKVSLSVAACALVENGKGESELVVPVFQAKSPYCFAGTLRLYRKSIEGKKPDGQSVNPDPNHRDFDILVGTVGEPLVWNNDNAALTYDGKDGWSQSLTPAGGYYDTVFNLQAYYRTWSQGVESSDVSALPKELLPGTSYEYVTEGCACSVALAGDAVAVDKKVIVKDGKLVDFGASTNPCNLQVKLARATGLVTGSFSLWAQTKDGTAQKEITGFKHYGVVVLQRPAYESDGYLSEGFMTQKVKVQSRTWNLSLPFLLTNTDHSPVDWFADDDKWE